MKASTKLLFHCYLINGQTPSIASITHNKDAIILEGMIIIKRPSVQNYMTVLRRLDWIQMEC